MIIGIVGKTRSGKDTVGKLIQYFTSKQYDKDKSLEQFILEEDR